MSLCVQAVKINWLGDTVTDHIIIVCDFRMQFKISKKDYAYIISLTCANHCFTLISIII